jgi:hypothetical protein
LDIPSPSFYCSLPYIIGKTVGSPQHNGFREAQLGNAQAWYYHEDKTIVLWECFFEDRFRKHQLPKDTNMQNLSPLNIGLLGNFQMQKP